MSVLEKQAILSTLKEMKAVYEKDGVLLLGLFGSYIRDEATEESDIDILIETTPLFLSKYRGLRAYVKLDEVRENLEKVFGKKVDIVDKQGLIQHGNTYILDKAVYV